MNSDDTVKLLREIDAGIKMGISSIDDVVDSVSSPELKEHLSECKAEHEELMQDIQKLLLENCDAGKEPNAMAKGMSWFKTNVKMMADKSDATVADLMTDGCNMGIKSLSRYLNQYKAADRRSKGLAKNLICAEEDLVTNIRPFL